MTSPQVAGQDWICVYPNYLDLTKTVPEGRRVAKEHAISMPNIRELAEACLSLGLKYAVEDKSYPRDWLIPGRVRIERPSDLSKSALLTKLAIAIGTMKHRTQKPAETSSSAPAVAKKKGKK